MKLTLMLADSAQAVNGKLYILGGGWSITNASNLTMSIAIKLEVPWIEANTRHNLKLILVTEDETPVKMEDGRNCEVQGDFEVGRPAGLRSGTPLDVTLAVNIARLNLSPDSGYVWRCFIDGNTRDDWQLSFSTRPTGPTSQP
jgi:hypothetical protein